MLILCAFVYTSIILYLGTIFGYSKGTKSMAKDCAKIAQQELKEQQDRYEKIIKNLIEEYKK